ncbi:hypothetical protein [Flavivirga spongiicola]|uniref:Uncharacterized protein n=1 Tax=Flavivirga spongiicola TaxID=421621 RepID=A0ABU7XUJ9_9FLAO|nr:hypothetical protein [Flavivirga sp. MEBiC05379]MDO5979463.1 hypothetical protein [Flavivirga sp. MEBiC05379]
MSFIYILSPLQTQVYRLLHKISHHLVLENHHKEKHSDDNNHHDHMFLSNFSFSEKHHHNKKEHAEHHTHEFLSFISSIFYMGHTQNDTEKHPLDIKLDKHILPKKRIDQEQFSLVMRSIIWFYDSRITSCELDVNIPPPKTTST